VSPDELELLDVEDVIELHAAQLEAYGGSAGLRDRGLLESAVAQPQPSFGGQARSRRRVRDGRRVRVADKDAVVRLVFDEKAAPYAVLEAIELLRVPAAPTLGRMSTRAKTAKISITVPADDLAWARRVAGKRKTSLSLVVSEALAAKRREAAKRSLVEWLQEGITLDQRELETLRQEWQG
jgi:hypothetical protein